MLFIHIGLLHFHLLLLNFVQPLPPAPARMVNGNPYSSSQSPATLAASSLPDPSSRGISWSVFCRIKFNGKLEIHGRCQIVLNGHTMRILDIFM